MKRFWLTVVAVLALCAVALAFSTDYAVQSGEKTADALILNGAGYLYGMSVSGLDGTNDLTVAVFDNTSTGGTALTPEITFTTSADLKTGEFFPPIPIAINKGIYVDITTSGTVKYMIYYRAK